MKNELFDQTSEIGIIATLIHKPEFVLHSEALKPNYFYKEENQCIYWAIIEQFKKGRENIDAMSIITQLKANKIISERMKHYDEQSLIEFVDNNGVLARESLEEYKELCNIVISLSFRREMASTLILAKQKCLTISDLNTLNQEVYQSMDGLMTKYMNNQEELTLLGDDIDGIWQSIVDSRNPDGSYGIPPAWKNLKDYYSYEGGELYLYGARRKHGKSVILMNEAYDKLKMGLPVLYFDTELKKKLFVTRFIAHITGIDHDRIKSGKVGKEEDSAIRDTLNWLKSVKFQHVYEPSWTRESVYTKFKLYKNKMNTQFFIHDYIKITDNKLTSSSEQYNELGNWCNFLKNEIAGAFDMPVLSAVQLNRNYDIADSDKIERYASSCGFWLPKSQEEIQRDGYDCGNYKMKIAFNRNGDSHDMQDDMDYIDFDFRKPILTIGDTKVQHELEVPEFLQGDE